MRPGLVEEIQSIVDALDLQHLILIVTEEQLLQEVESLLMGHLLTDLDGSSPCMRSELLLTVLTLLVMFGELTEERLNIN